MHAVEVGESALGERAQQVERRGGLVVAAHHALRIGTAGDGVEREVVDDVAEVRRQLDAVALLDRRRARLGELARDAADLQRRDAGAVRQHHRHLQDDLELVADVVGRELGERLRAVARVQQEALPSADARRAIPAASAPRPRTRAAACARSSSMTRRRARPASGHSGCCAAARRCQLAGSQSKLPSGTGAVIDRSRSGRSAVRGRRRACARRCRPARASGGCASPRTGAAPASAG